MKNIARNLPIESLPLSLYIHVPWCIKKCPYCDFNSYAIDKNGFDENAYIDALLKDFHFALPSIQGRIITSIFIGGGTPNLLSYHALERLIRSIDQHGQIIKDCEITLEANPGTVDQAYFCEFHQIGISRLSLGVQSFSDQHLSILGRIHSGRDAQRAIEKALNYFKNINVDLMYALPHQTPEAALSDLNIAIAAGVNHISAYQLTLEPNTLFGQLPPHHLPNHDQSFRIEQAIQQKLRQANFLHYEISAFAQNNQFCQHNLNYWQFGDYLGIGAGAHSKITWPNKILRIIKQKHPKTYMEGVHNQNPILSQYIIQPHEIGLEFMMNALRLIKGFKPTLFNERTGYSLASLQKILEKAQAKKLMVINKNIVRASRLGRRFLNDLLLLFVQENPNQ